MITKRNYIDLLQNRLNGGNTPRDLRKMYNRGTITKLVNMVFTDVAINNPDAAADMAIPYTYTPTTDASGYYITLNPMSIAGSQTIFQIQDDKNDYHIQDKVMANAIRVLRGTNKYGAILFGTKLRFNTQPQGDVVVTLVPNVYQMGDDDILYAGELGDSGETKVFQLCLQLLKTPEFQDELNNNAVDAQQGR